MNLGLERYLTIFVSRPSMKLAQVGPSLNMSQMGKFEWYSLRGKILRARFERQKTKKVVSL